MGPIKFLNSQGKNMEIEQMIQLAIVVFLILMVAFAVIWGPNVPWLLSARQKTYKEIDPNAALNLKSQLWDSCALSKPKFVARLVFQGHPWCQPPDPIPIEGMMNWEGMYIIAFYRRRIGPIGWHKAIMFCPREYLTPPTTSDLIIQAAGLMTHADHYWVPLFCDSKGQVLPQGVLESLDNEIWNKHYQLQTMYMRSITSNIHWKEQAQAQTGRASEEFLGMAFSGGDPRAIPQDEYGQEEKMA